MKAIQVFLFVLILTQTVFGACHLNLPKGWEMIRDRSQLPEKIEVIYIGSGKGKFTPSINIAKEETPLPIEEYITVARKYHEGVGNTQCSPLGKLATAEGTAYLIQIDRQTEWGPIRFIQAFCLKGNQAYVITATCLQEEFSHLSTQIFKGIQSFKLE